MTRIGVIGTGIFATERHLPAIAQVDGLTINACYNRTRAKAEAFAKEAQKFGQQVTVYDTVEELLASDIDAVDALLPVEYNLEMVQKAVKAGKPISIEKPIAASLDDAAKIVEIAEKGTVPVMVLENWTYHHATVVMKDLLPRIGKVHMFCLQISGPFRLTEYHATQWRQHPKHAGGFLSDAGVHDVSLITEVLGEIGSVSARTMQSKEESKAVDTLSALLNMRDGTFGTYTQNRYSGAAKLTIRFEIFGSNGSLLFEKPTSGEPNGTVTLYEGTGVADLREEVFPLKENVLNGVVSEFEDWRDLLNHKTKSLVATPRKSFAQYATICAAVESAEADGNLVHVRSL